MQQPTADIPGQAPATEHDQLRLRGRALLWFVFGFAVCPCHLPFTLLALGALFGGTAIGATITGNPLVVGIALGIITALAYRKGLRLLRAADTCATGACSTTVTTTDEEARVLTRR